MPAGKAIGSKEMIRRLRPLIFVAIGGLFFVWMVGCSKTDKPDYSFGRSGANSEEQSLPPLPLMTIPKALDAPFPTFNSAAL